MFTGIIEEVGRVVAAERGRLRVRADRVLEETSLGDSIAIDGVDLTVTAIVDSELEFGVMPETYRRTTLEGMIAGRRVNLERSVRAADRLSGHIVRGVVECVGRVESQREDGDATVITYSAPPDLLARVVNRGPICVDGISLTVVANDSRTFSVSIVKYTADHTTVLEKSVGDTVNLESDILMRYVTEAIAATMESLPEKPTAPLGLASQ